MAERTSPAACVRRVASPTGRSTGRPNPPKRCSPNCARPTPAPACWTRSATRSTTCSAGTPKTSCAASPGPSWPGGTARSAAPPRTARSGSRSCAGARPRRPEDLQAPGHPRAPHITGRPTGRRAHAPRPADAAAGAAHLPADQLPRVRRGRLPGVQLPRRGHEHRPVPEPAGRLPARPGPPGQGDRARRAPGLLRQRHPPERDPGRRRSRRGVLAEHQRHRRRGARDLDQHRPAHRGGPGRERRGRRPDAGAGRRPGVVPVRRGPQPALPPDGPARLGILDLHPAPPRGRPRGGPADRGLPAGHSRRGAPVRPRRPRDRRRRDRLPGGGGGHGRGPGPQPRLPEPAGHQGAPARGARAAPPAGRLPCRRTGRHVPQLLRPGRAVRRTPPGLRLQGEAHAHPAPPGPAPDRHHDGASFPGSCPPPKRRCLAARGSPHRRVSQGS